MTAEPGRNDYIGRIRQRHGGQPAAAEPPARRFIVQITRDGRSTEELVFDRAPSIGAIAARAGTEAYVIAVDVIDPETERLAAE